MVHSRPLFRLFLSFQTNITIFTPKICDKCPFSIRGWDSNPRPSKRESTPVTPRPGLPPSCHTVCSQDHFSGDCTTEIRIKHDGSKYCGINLKQDLNWTGANKFCTDMGARLPIIKSDIENRDLFDFFVSSGKSFTHF